MTPTSASPFEFFRTPLTLYRFVTGQYVDGRWIEGTQVALDGPLVSGNSVTLTLNGVSLGPVVFSGTSDETLQAICDLIAQEPGILQAKISGADQFIVEPLNNDVADISAFIIAGGASQPTPTITLSPQPIPITASIQPIDGKTLISVPEGRRTQAKYKLFTNYALQDLNTANPDQVEIFGERFEVLNLLDWQNNSNLLPVNHYKFIAISLTELQ